MIDNTPELRVWPANGIASVRICGTDDELIAMFCLLASYLIHSARIPATKLGAAVFVAEKTSAEDLLCEGGVPVAANITRIPCGKGGTHHDG